MEKEIMLILKSKDISVNENEVKEINKELEYVNRLKSRLKTAQLAERRIGIIHRLGGVTNE